MNENEIKSDPNENKTPLISEISIHLNYRVFWFSNAYYF